MNLQELLGAELYAQVMAALGDKAQIAIISDGSYIPKAKFDERGDEIKTLKAQVTEHEKQLTTLSAAAGDNEALKTQIKKLQDDNAAAAADFDEKTKKQAFNHALERVLDKSKAKNPKAVRALLDMEKIKQDGETLLGLEDQLTELKKSDPYLFDDSTPGGGGGANPPGGGGGNFGKVNPWKKETHNLTEQMRIEKENPALAAQMAAAAGVKL